MSYKKVSIVIVREQTGPCGWSRDETMSVVQRSERSSESSERIGSVAQRNV